MPNRRHFIKSSAVLCAASLLHPPVSYSAFVSTEMYWGALLRRAGQLAWQFIQKVSVDAVEEYAVEKLVDFIKDTVGDTQEQQEIAKIEKATQININNYHHEINVYGIRGSNNQFTFGMIPLCQSAKINAAFFTEKTYLPIVGNRGYLTHTDFPTLPGLYQMAKTLEQNYLDRTVLPRRIRQALLPVAVIDQRNLAHRNDFSISSTLYHTQKGKILVEYEIDRHGKLEGQITYLPPFRYSDFAGEKVDFKYFWGK